MKTKFKKNQKVTVFDNKGIDYATAYRQDGQWQPFDGFYCDCIVDCWMPIPKLSPEKS